MIDYKIIGKKIRERRIACELSQEKLAEICDVGTTHISHIETGNCVPSLKFLKESLRKNKKEAVFTHQRQLLFY